MTTPKKTKKEAKKRALKTVRNKIATICGDFIVAEKLYAASKCHDINKELYNEEEVKPIKDINELISNLKKKWLDEIRRKIEIEKTSKEVAKWNIIIENYAKETDERNGILKSIDDNFNISTDKFLSEAIDNLLKGSLMLFQRIKVNPHLWSSVIAAKLFHVPESKILECAESILYKYYLPKISNDDLIFRFNELTELSDLILMWSSVKIKQKEYKAKHGYINSEKEYSSRPADKIITEGFNNGLNSEQIHTELKKIGITKKYSARDMNERRKVYNKKIRQPKWRK
jgi:hypothetical protein